MKPKGLRPSKKVEAAPFDKDKCFPVVGDDGVTRWFREKTGEPVDSPLDTRHYRPYNKRDAEVIGQWIARGSSVSDALERTGIPRSTYIQWRRENPEFTAMVEGGRRLRAEEMHEGFGEELKTVEVSVSNGNPDEMDTVELKEYQMRTKVKKEMLAVLEKKQGILQKFTRDDAPNRFGTDRIVIDTEGDKLLETDMGLPDNVVKLLEERFTPSIKSDGGFEVKGIKEDEVDLDAVPGDDKKHG